MPLFSERSQPKFDSYRLKVIQTVWLKKLPDQNVKIFWSKHWFITIKRSPQTLAVWPRIRVSHLYTYMLVQVTNNPRAFEYLYCWKILKSNFRFFLESTFLFRCRAQFYYCLFSLLEVKPSFLFFFSNPIVIFQTNPTILLFAPCITNLASTDQNYSTRRTVDLSQKQIKATMKFTTALSAVAIFILPRLADAGAISNFFFPKDCVVRLGTPSSGIADSVTKCIKRGSSGELRTDDGDVVNFVTDDKCNPSVAPGSTLPPTKVLDVARMCNAK